MHPTADTKALMFLQRLGRMSRRKLIGLLSLLLAGGSSASPAAAGVPGQRADLLLLEANPLTKVDNISQIAGVTMRGRWLSRGRLEKMRDEAAGSFTR